MHTFNPATKAESVKVNENFQNLSTGEDDTDNNKLALTRAELYPNFVATGLYWSILSGLNGAMTAGVGYVLDSTPLMNRLVVSAITSRTFTASKDTYVDLLSDGTISYTEVANGATTGMTLASTSLRLAKVVTNGSAITSITQENADPLGNVIRNMSPVRTLRDEAWQTPTFLNGWVNYGGSWGVAGYYKDSMGIVHLKGLIKNGTAVDSTPIFNLPVGYRPLAPSHVAAVGGSGNGHIKILATSVAYGSGTGNGWLTLEGIHFKADG